MDQWHLPDIQSNNGVIKSTDIFFFVEHGFRYRGYWENVAS